MSRIPGWTKDMGGTVRHFDGAKIDVEYVWLLQRTNHAILCFC